MEIKVATGWFRSNDRPNPNMNDTGERVMGRMVEIQRGETWIPAIEHKVEGGEHVNRDVSHTWAVPEKLSDKDFAHITTRFSSVFEAYRNALEKMEADKAKEELEIQARIDSEVKKQVSAKSKTETGKEVK